MHFNTTKIVFLSQHDIDKQIVKDSPSNAFGIRLLLKLGHILELKVERFNTKGFSSIYI